jgi:hypothetical protein
MFVMESGVVYIQISIRGEVAITELTVSAQKRRFNRVFLVAHDEKTDEKEFPFKILNDMLWLDSSWLLPLSENMVSTVLCILS